MKKVFLFLTIFFSFYSAKAGELMGAELTWRCVKSGPGEGKFIFTIVKYWRCAPHWHGGAVNISNGLYATYGGPATIYIPYLASIESMDTCWSSLSNEICGPTLDGYLIKGAYTQSSDTISLTGIPSVSGTTFHTIISSTSRLPNGRIGNIGPLVNINTTGYYIRAVMFPYFDANTGQYRNLDPAQGGCYDSSPVFAEKPISIHCLSRNETFSYSVMDPESDSVTYSWSPPLTSSGTSFNWVTFRSGYSITSPTAGPGIYSSNVAANLDTITGDMTFKVDSPAGHFASCVKIAAYKNGQKVSETYREHDIWLLNCPASFPTTKPTIEYLEKGSTTYTSSFRDTIQIGDSIELGIRSTDLGLISASPLVLQAPSIKIGGLQAASPNDTFNCTSPPCAFLDSVGNSDWNGVEFRQTSITQAKFKWKADCAHLKSNFSSNGHIRMRTFTFYVYSNDQVCPVPDNSKSSFTITVVDSSSYNHPIEKIHVNGNSIFIEWEQYNGSAFNFYKLNRYNNSSGNWNLLTTSLSAGNRQFYHNLTNQYSGPITYRVDLNQNENCYSTPYYQSIFLGAQEVNDRAELEWNSPYVTPVPHNLKFYVERINPSNQAWVRIDSTDKFVMDYVDTIPHLGTWNIYRIVSEDDNGLEAISNKDSVYICEHKSYSSSESICKGDSILIHNIYRKSAGTYGRMYYTNMSCDSFVDVNLSVNSLNVDINYSGSNLSTSLTQATYQWKDCDNGQNISGATSRTYVPAKNGNYYVVVTKDMCTDSSDCLEVTNVGIESYIESSIRLYPNPVNDRLYIESDLIEYDVVIYNSSMQKIFISKGQANSSFDLSSLQTGIYLVQISQQEKVVKSIRVLKN